MKIAVFGLGYVGVVTAAGLAARGHEVWGVDVDGAKVASLRSGRSPIVEPGIDDLIAEALAADALHPTTEVAEAMAGAHISVFCVGTPSAPNGDSDLGAMRRALADTRRAMETLPPPEDGFHAVVVRSTVPPGTGDHLVAPTFADPVPNGWQVGTAMCPEFLREGSSVADFFDPPLVVLGSADERVRRRVEQMFAFLDRPVRHVGVRSAEGLKYASNAFHATKVSFANEMGRVLRACGVDSREVMELFCEDRVLNISPAYLRPGFAFGGSCLPKDLRALLHLARTHALDVPQLSGTLRTNALVVDDVVDRVIATGARSVALLGLSFKQDTDDLRESPYVDLAERLIGKGFEVRIYDPIVNPERLVGANRRYVASRLPHLDRLLSATAREALEGVEVALQATTDPEAVRALLAAAPRHVVDLTGSLGAAVEAMPGYDGIGWAV